MILENLQQGVQGAADPPKKKPRGRGGEDDSWGVPTPLIRKQYLLQYILPNAKMSQYGATQNVFQKGSAATEVAHRASAWLKHFSPTSNELILRHWPCQLNHIVASVNLT